MTHPPWAPPRSPVRGIGAGGKLYNFWRGEIDRGGVRHVSWGCRDSAPEFLQNALFAERRLSG